MFVRCKKRFKDGKEHRYWSVVENVRVSGGRVVQRQVLYLGEINDSQRAAWCRSIEVVEGASRSKQVALFQSRGPGGAGAGVRGGAGAARAADLARPAPVGARDAGGLIVLGAAPERINVSSRGSRCGSVWSWTGSGDRACRRAAKGPDGWIF